MRKKERNERKKKMEEQTSWYVKAEELFVAFSFGSRGIGVNPFVVRFWLKFNDIVQRIVLVVGSLRKLILKS